MNLPPGWTKRTQGASVFGTFGRADGLCVDVCLDKSAVVYWATSEQQDACDPESWRRLWDAVAVGRFPGHPMRARGLMQFDFPKRVLCVEPEAFIAEVHKAFPPAPTLEERVAAMERRLAALEAR